MSAATSRLLIPYLQGPDPLSDVAAALEAIAEAVEGLVAGPSAAGVASCTPSAANADTTKSVAFPAGRFEAGDVPVVVLTARITNHNNTPALSVTNIDETGFDIVFRRANTTTFDCGWVATLERT